MIERLLSARLLGLLCIVGAGFVLILFVQGKSPREARAVLGEAQQAVLSAAAEGEGSDEVDANLDRYMKAIAGLPAAIDLLWRQSDKQTLLLEAFHSLASQRTLLRGIRRRPPFGPLDSVDRARSSNIAIEEQLVDRLEKMPRGAVEINKTSTALACKDCNLVIISLTTMRKDHMGLYGYEKPTTPNIDQFFKDSLVFHNTLAPSAWTIPDAISLFTALFPYSHGVAVREPLSVPLLYNRKVQTLAQILSENGYETAAFTGGGDYNDRFSGLKRGFDFYLDETNYKDYSITNIDPLGSASLLYAPLRDFIRLPEKWIEEHAAKKFFLFVQGYDTHCPYAPREPYARKFTAGLSSTLDFSYCYTTHEDTESIQRDGKSYWNVQVGTLDKTLRKIWMSEDDVTYMRALYDARLSEADAHVGRVLRKIRDLGLEKKTIILIMSEHGEMLGENGWFMRGGSTRGTAYQPALNFPLALKHPKIASRGEVNDLLQTVDIMPTLLAMFDISDPQSSLRDGKVLSLSVFGDSPTYSHIFGASMFLPSAKSRFFAVPTSAEVVRDKEWKLIKNTVFSEEGLKPESVTYQLFNIWSDPYESIDLHAKEPERARMLRSILEDWLSQFSSLPWEER